jgi:hypothetical protein
VSVPIGSVHMKSYLLFRCWMSWRRPLHLLVPTSTAGSFRLQLSWHQDNCIVSPSSMQRAQTQCPVSICFQGYTFTNTDSFNYSKNRNGTKTFYLPVVLKVDLPLVWIRYFVWFRLISTPSWTTSTSHSGILSPTSVFRSNPPRYTNYLT